jgi:transcriptional antiterminator Rof (Rho-off)
MTQKKRSSYKPISCSLYDELELLATGGNEVEVQLQSGEILVDTFITFESRKGKGEFAILKSGREIRLDNLKSVNGIAFNQEHC